MKIHYSIDTPCGATYRDYVVECGSITGAMLDFLQRFCDHAQIGTICHFFGKRVLEYPYTEVRFDGFTLVREVSKR